MGYKSAADLHTSLANTQKEMQLNLAIGDKNQSVAWQDLGVAINQDAVVSDALEYPWYHKIIPFSSVYRALTEDTVIATKVDEPQLKAYTEKLAAENYHGPANASLSITGTTVVRNNQKSGYEFEPTSVARQITEAPYAKGATLAVQSKEVPAAFTAQEIEEIAKQAEAIIATETKVDIAGKTQVISAAERASWLKFTETNDAKHIAIDTDKEKIKSFLANAGKEAYRAPGTVTVTMRDGRELQRTPDTSGQSVDAANGANIVTAAVLTKKADTTAVPLTKIPPKLAYQRTYTKSQAGVNALVNDISAEEPDMAITVRSLDGSGIVASAKGSKQYAPASTYKLPVALTVFKRLEAGTLQWTDNVNGRNVEKCMYDMIVLSDNPCASAFGDKLGWQAVTDDARAAGMVRTNLAKGFVSTTDDQAIFLAKLQQGGLMNPANQERLLSLMKQQKYRSGIPAGVNGATVADKVGFINGLLHDSAIVYSPGGAYVLVIYSDKSSWARLATATTKIHGLMNQ